MLSQLSTLRRASLSLQLLRHFSIRVSRKQRLVAQNLRGNDSPKLSKLTRKGGLFLDARSNVAKATQQREASLRSVYQHSPLGVSVEPPVLENGRQQEQRLVEDDACLAKLSVRSKKESKEAQHRDGATMLSVPSRSSEGSKAHHSEGDMLSKLSVPSLREGSNQPSLRAQTGSYGAAKLFQTESRKVGPAKVSVRSQIAGEEGYDSRGPVESKPGSQDGKRIDLQTRGASRKPCLPISISPFRTGSSKEISSSASQIGDEPGKCITGHGSSTERGEQDAEQNAIKHSLSLKKFVPSPGRETSKQSNVKHKITNIFLHDLQRKIELVSEESAPLTHVKALLAKRVFLSESPEKLAEVLTVLKLFFESSDKAREILIRNTRIIAQPLEQLLQRLQVLVEFEVDKATCYRLGTKPYLMALKVENYQSVLSFLKELGLSAESRNRMICKCPDILRRSVEIHMQPAVNFFESIGTARPTLLKLVESSPRTVCNMNATVMHKLFQHVGLSSKEFIKASRKMSHYSTTQYFSRYSFFREQGLSDEAFANMIKREPTILSMAEETLKAKLHFVLHTTKWDISDIVRFPAYFKYSLTSRIIPRCKILEELNLPRWPCLSTIVASPKSVFMTILKISDSSKCM